MEKNKIVFLVVLLLVCALPLAAAEKIDFSYNFMEDSPDNRPFIKGLSYAVFDVSELYEKPEINAQKTVTVPAGTEIKEIGYTDKYIGEPSNGEAWLSGTIDGRKLFMRDSVLAKAWMNGDIDGDGKKELVLYGLDLQKYREGNKDGIIKVIKGGKIAAEANFEPMIWAIPGRVPGDSGYAMAISLVAPKGFIPPVKFIKLSYRTSAEGYRFGDVYFLWRKGKMSHVLTVKEYMDPVDDLTCKAYFPVEKGGKTNRIIIKESFDYGSDEPPKEGQGGYDRTAVYKWDGKSFSLIKDEKKFRKWVPYDPE